MNNKLHFYEVRYKYDDLQYAEICVSESEEELRKDFSAWHNGCLVSIRETKPTSFRNYYSKEQLQDLYNQSQNFITLSRDSGKLNLQIKDIGELKLLIDVLEDWQCEYASEHKCYDALTSIISRLKFKLEV